MTSAGSTCRRIPVAPGVEVLMDENIRRSASTATWSDREALRQALASVVGMESSLAVRDAAVEANWMASEDEQGC